jgi:hypothetical protein
MSQSDLTSMQEQVLRTSTISDEVPGALLHDFQVVLDFVAEVSPPLTKKRVLAMKSLQPLNERLSRRIEHGLARPQQKSFPHINGLFLLLRASGLTRVDATGRATVLVIDPPVADSWNGLNATERYFMLLESWLLRGHVSILGERSGHFAYTNPIRQWFDFFQMFDNQNWYGDDWTERVRYTPGYHNLALMELFGFVNVEDAPAEPKRAGRSRIFNAQHGAKPCSLCSLSE